MSQSLEATGSIFLREVRSSVVDFECIETDGFGCEILFDARLAVFEIYGSTIKAVEAGPAVNKLNVVLLLSTSFRNY